MHKNQRVAEMAGDVLARQARDRANRNGEPFEEALRSVLETVAGRQLGELRDGSHRDESAQDWQEDLVWDRARQRKREQAEERKREQDAAAWERFMQAELRELGLRKGGQVARSLGEPLPGEPQAALERLALEDQRQAEEGLVALMSRGKVSYKHLGEPSPEDMPARIAANRARTVWPKERRDGWLGRGEVSRRDEAGEYGRPRCEEEVLLIGTTTKLGPCQVQSKTERPCPNQAVLKMRGTPFCERCAREQEVYFAIGKLTMHVQGLASDPELARRIAEANKH